MAAGRQHLLEFGGSHVTTEFDGSLRFDLLYRIPYISVSHEFTGMTARQIRYALVATVGSERPFYHRWPWVILDVQMISAWEEGSGDFLAALQDRLREIDGELFLVATGETPAPAGIPVFASPDEAVEAARTARAEYRASRLQA